jgi:hypothetical protein
MKRLVWMFVIAVVVQAALIGCGKSTSSVSSSGAKLFQTADADSKAKWEKGMELAKADDYVGAILTLRSLYVQPNLSPEQKKAIEDAQKVVSDKMYQASNKGDPKAKAAIEELRKASGR